ncbi:MAG: LTA synthase family protein, partial [Candidatus Neomarinimicrobiota bacterium]|nr:LTA synthase family protein [Candidatus Neomarinimicrobiota bacterium]
DMGHYSYLGRRIDISVLRFLENPQISAQMVWESYPVIIILIILSFIFIGFKLIYDFVPAILYTTPILKTAKRKFFGFTISSLIILFSAWGTLKQYPLRWSDAFFSNNSFISALGLNPILYYNDTRRFARDDFNINKAKEYHRDIVEFLGIKDQDPGILNYGRYATKLDHPTQSPNIVIIFLESVGANRLSKLGNSLNATPNLDQIIEDGIFFKRFYVPMVGTARSVFTMVTGIPDVARIKTSSRNPRINKQYSIINDFTGYEKHYIMGGSAGWANIRGFLQLNIPDLLITELDDLKSPRLDVWGVSDYDLFKETHQIFENIDPGKPFFAIIQTATNHRPYSIPDNVTSFKVDHLSKEKVNHAGFKSVDQYNAMRLLDHTIGEYFSYAKKSKYFSNTVFFLFGDHGTSDPWAKHMPQSDYELLLRSYHVPLIIYGPGIIKGGIMRNDIAMLPDLIPTAAGFAGISYHNQTLGRDLMSIADNQEGLALTVGKKHARPTIGVFGSHYYLTMYHDGKDIRLYDLNITGSPEDIHREQPEIASKYSRLVQGLYETSKYMLYHNSQLLNPVNSK